MQRVKIRNCDSYETIIFIKTPYKGGFMEPIPETSVSPGTNPVSEPNDNPETVVNPPKEMTIYPVRKASVGLFGAGGYANAAVSAEVGASTRYGVKQGAGPFVSTSMSLRARGFSTFSGDRGGEAVLNPNVHVGVRDRDLDPVVTFGAGTLLGYNTQGKGVVLPYAEFDAKLVGPLNSYVAVGMDPRDRRNWITEFGLRDIDPDSKGIGLGVYLEGRADEDFLAMLMASVQF